MFRKSSNKPKTTKDPVDREVEELMGPPPTERSAHNSQLPQNSDNNNEKSQNYDELPPDTDITPEIEEIMGPQLQKSKTDNTKAEIENSTIDDAVKEIEVKESDRALEVLDKFDKTATKKTASTKPTSHKIINSWFLIILLLITIMAIVFVAIYPDSRNYILNLLENL